MIITSLAGLVSCGSKSVGKLEVSQSFATANTSFGGGLVISGKHLSSGKTFSHSILSGKEMRINLEQGFWKISAVGWDGGGTPGTEKLFAGNPFCGTVTANLANSSTVVDLNINQANCNTTEFSQGHTFGGNLKVFGAVVTCNTFFQPAININNPISTQIIAAGVGTDDFCESSALDPDLKSKVKAVKIYSNNKLPDQAAPSLGFNTGCMQGTSGLESKIFPTDAVNPYNGYIVKLPFNNLPLTFVTFEDTSCNKPLATFHFKDGIAAGSESFDHLLQDRGSSDMKLILPANDLKRAKSALIGLLPSIKKDVAGTPTKFGTTPSNLGSLTYPAILNTHHKVILNEDDCGSTAPVATGPVLFVSCLDLGNRIELNYKGGATTGAANIKIYDGATIRSTYNMTVISNSGLESVKYKSQAKVIELLGQDVESESIFFEQNEDDKEFGVLSNIRHMFAADGAGGVLGLGSIDATTTFAEACNGLVMDKTETVYNEDRMSFESYRVNIHDGVVGSPTNYMCKTNVLSSSDCTTATGGIAFDKRMTIYDHKISTVQPIFVMEFSCEQLVGRFEMNELEVNADGLSRSIKKQLLSWNTNPDSNLLYQRLENISFTAREKNVAGNWITVAETRDMSRLQKINIDNFAAWSYHFQTVFDGTNHKQEIQSLFLETINNGDTLIFSHNPLSDSDAINRFSIFSSGSAVLTNAPMVSAADKFDLAAAYPQAHTTPGVTYVTLPAGNNTDKIDGRLIFQLDQLVAGAFGTTFGSSFYTAP